MKTNTGIPTILIVSLFIFLFIHLLWGTFFLSAETPETVFLNLDFEHVYYEGTPKYWSSYNTIYTTTTDKTVVKSGEKSLLMECSTPNKQFGALTQIFPVQGARGKAIRLSGWIKTENLADGYAGFWMRADAENRKVLQFADMSKNNIKGTTPWAKYDIGFDVPADTDKIYFGTVLVGTGKAWFDDLTITLDGKPYKQILSIPQHPTAADISWLKKNAVVIKDADPKRDMHELTPLKKMIGNSRIAALGEGTHGTAEFFKMKHRLTRFLAEEMGFTIFAIEANMPEARAVNRYVLYGEGDPKEALAGMYFWTWNTQEVLDMILWMREYNQSGKGTIQFYGYDMQFPTVALDTVTEFISKNEPQYLETLKKEYDVVRAQWQHAKNMEQTPNYQKWYDAAKRVLDHMTANRSKYLENLKPDAVAWALQDAEIVVQGCEGFIGKRSRDQCMAQNLDWILEHSPKGTKIISWAHNGHVARKRSISTPMGEYLAKKHGNDMFVFGFAFHEGTYTAKGPDGLSVYGTAPSEPGSIEWYFKTSNIPNLILDLRTASDSIPGSQWLLEKKSFRSIGALAAVSAFYDTNITQEFDALIYFQHSTPTQCLREEWKKGKDWLTNKEKQSAK